MKLTAKVTIITALLYTAQVTACTTILIGNQATDDGSFIVARNEDSSAMNAKHVIIPPAAFNQKGKFTFHVNAFSYPQPKSALRYSAITDFNTHDRSMSGAGFNSAGVGISATETIYNNLLVLKFDPYVKTSGITEDAIPDVILPRIHHAREGVRLPGKIIEQRGAGEGFGVAFVDRDELWYLETGSGHQWMAERLPGAQYFVSANQGRLQHYQPENTADYMGSPTLISFARLHHLYDPQKEGAFNFRKVYVQDGEHDLTFDRHRGWR